MALAPVLLVVLLVVLALVPCYLGYRFGLRLVVELSWGLRGRRILLVYSRSPVWQEHIEANWLPRLAGRAVVLDWSDRARWSRRRSLAVWVFRHWAPERDYNPMALLFPPLARTRRLLFHQAFRDWKHGNAEPLRRAEQQLFAFAEDGK